MKAKVIVIVIKKTSVIRRYSPKKKIKQKTRRNVLLMWGVMKTKRKIGSHLQRNMSSRSR